MNTPAPAVYQPILSFVDWYPEEFRSDSFDRYSELLRRTKSEADDAALTAAVSAATRYAAVDTGAIEGLYSVDRGFTRTVATQSAAWEVAMASRGSHVREAFDDAMSAYEFVLDAATKSVVVTEVFIRELHALICTSQNYYTVYTAVGPQRQELPKGVYKTMPNSPTLEGGHIHAYAPVQDTAPEMARLVQELRSESFSAAHPIVQAAYAHYAYVCIHPFADGNGRVARALASIYLYRNPGIPLVIFADQRNPYFDALEAADRGNSKPFVEFIGERAVDTIGLVRSSIRSSTLKVGETVDNLRQFFQPTSLDDEEVRAAVVRLRDLAVNELSKQMNEMGLPEAITYHASAQFLLHDRKTPAGYDLVGEDGAFYARISSKWPKSADVWVIADVGVASISDGRGDLVLCSDMSNELEVWVREIAPNVTETAKMKIANWTEGLLIEALTRFQRDLAAN